MIPLKEYRQYWENVALDIPDLSGVFPVGVDKNMARALQSLPLGSKTLFVLPPGGQSKSDSPDAFREANLCVVFVMEKYDPQRRSSFDVLETSQEVIEAIKERMISDSRMNCMAMKFDLATINTLPETEFFAGFAGWSIGFELITD